MAKYATKRKRSYKKRRTIRKSKTTPRRKIQRGGNPAIAYLFFILMALFSNSPVGRAFITILEFLVGMTNKSGGSSKNFKQSGGGKLGDALRAFNTEIQADMTILPGEKTGINNCVNTLTRANTLDSVPTTFGNDVIVDNTSTPPETRDPNALKNFFQGKIDNIKSLVLSKVNFIKDENNKNCMRTILNFGFKLMTQKLSSMKPEELIAAKAKALAENAKAFGANAKARLTNMWSNRSSIVSSMPQNLQQGKEMGSQLLNNKEQNAQDIKSKGSDMFKTFSSSIGSSFGRKTS